MDRRRLIKLAALSLVGLALPVVWRLRDRADVVFSDMFGDSRFAARIGRIRHANDPTSAVRGRALVADLVAQQAPLRGQRLLERADADLTALNVVVVDGWVMARSEADLCAAVYLDRGLT